MAAFGLGTVFILVQSLSYMGYVNVDYNKAGASITKIFDLNNDGKVRVFLFLKKKMSFF